MYWLSFGCFSVLFCCDLKCLFCFKLLNLSVFIFILGVIIFFLKFCISNILLCLFFSQVCVGLFAEVFMFSAFFLCGWRSLGAVSVRWG